MTRVVLLIIALTVSAGFLLGKLDPKDFMQVAFLVFGSFFALKGNDNNTSDTPTID